jgi:hypothetical protein
VSQEELVTAELNELHRLHIQHHNRPITSSQIETVLRYMVRREILLRERIETLEKRLETFRTFGVMTR